MSQFASHRVGDNDERLRNLLLDVLKRKLYVDSQPRAARVFVENRYIGETPTEIGPFEEGNEFAFALSVTALRAFHCVTALAEAMTTSAASHSIKKRQTHPPAKVNRIASGYRWVLS